MNAQIPMKNTVEDQAVTDAVYSIAAEELRAFIERFDAPTFSEMIEAMDGIECWRNIPDSEGYQVSSWGRVRGKRVGILKTNKVRGYHRVCLSVDGVPHGVTVARAVLLAFVGAAPVSDAHAAHNDGDKDNNRLSNLRWATATENQADVERHGNRCKGSAVHGAVLNESDIPAIRNRISQGEKQAAIASEFGVSISTISLIKLGKIWSHA
jgi:hypothetical protein